MKNKLLLLLLLCIPFLAKAQECGALMIPLSLEERINQSTTIVEAQIESSQSYWDSNHHNIYTVHTLNVYKMMKGDSVSSIKIVTMGGQVGDEMQITSDAARFNIGQEGMFFLTPFPATIAGNNALYQLIGAAQGVVRYNKFSKKAADVFFTYNSVENDLYTKVQEVTNSGFQTIKERPLLTQNKAAFAVPNISSFSPSTVTAGTQTVLTISGSNFGNTMGSVNFANANTGGTTYQAALDSQIISWTDNQIHVEVPWFAGTGNIQVQNTDGTTTSGSILTVNYSHLNASTGTIDYSRYLRDSNGNGGFSFLYHTEFDTSSAKTYFEEAFDLWNCESDVNFVMGSGTTTTDVTAEDNINIIRFDNGNELPASTLGRVTTYYLTICNEKAIVKEMDITWNDGINWYYGSGTPSVTQHDFKTVALHELGHALGLGHVIDFNAVMHYGLSVGSSNYNLTQNDIDGAIYNMDVATQSVSCANAMTPQLNCCDAVNVTQQPQDETIATGATAQLTVAADNMDSVVWEFSDNNGVDWSTAADGGNFSGSTTTTLSFSINMEFATGYLFRAVLTNACGDSVNSENARVIVLNYTIIPDTNFEAALSTYDNIANDGQVPTSNINVITSLNVNNSNISDLTGISGFTALESLSLNDNSVTTLDLSGISNLTVVAARNNGLTSLDISTHTNMNLLLLENNNLTSLDVSNNINLTRLWAQNNNVNALDVSNNPLLRAIGISDSNLTSLDLTQNTALEQLFAGGNAITALDLSQNSVLRIIGVNNNNLSLLNVKNGNNTNVTTFAAGDNPNLTCVSVDDVAYSTTNWTSIDAQTSFSDFCNYTTIPDSNFEAALTALGHDDIANDGQVPTALIETVTSLNVSNNNIDSVTGIEDFVALETLVANENNLTSLDISNNPALSALAAADNNISTLNLGTNTNYEIINLNANNLTSINVVGFTDLFFLSVNDNPLISVDLSNNTALTTYSCNNCNLISLDIKNGNNTNVSTFDVRNNSDLTCILVDDATYSTNNWANIDAQTSFNDVMCTIDYTAIPDSNFETALNDFGYDDIANDGQVPTILISGVSTLNVNSKSISDLTGIEDFTSLTELKADSNTISTIDLSNNTLMQRLFLKNNNITSIDLSANTALLVLTLENNGLTSLDLSTNTAIGRLFLGGNNLTALDLRNNIALDVVGVNVNNLSSLNIKNGNNTDISIFVASSNPNLTCISVDDEAYSTANWTSIDAQTSFSDYCNYSAIPDLSFEDALGALSLDDISADGQVPTTLIEELTSLDVSGQMITNLSGIEAFVSLETLNVSDNELNSIDISSLVLLKNFYANNNMFNTLNLQSNTALERVQVDGNNLTTINTNNLTQLLELSVASNNLNTINVSPNTNLETLNINNNQIDENINLNAHTALINLSAQGNQLPSIDLTNNIALETIFLSNNSLTSANFRNGNNTNITSFDLTGNTGLTCVFVDDGVYSTTNWTNVDAQLTFTGTDYCGYTAIPDSSFEAALESLGYDDVSDDGQVPTELIENVTNLDISDRIPKIQDLTGIQDFTALEVLDVRANSLTNLDLSANTNLMSLNCFANSIVSLNVSGLTQLEELSCGRNKLANLELTTNVNLKTLDCNEQDQTLTSLDVSNLPLLTDLDCSLNYPLVTLNVKNGNNTNVTNFNASGTPNLNCILVDDVAYSTINWTNIDGQTSFSDVSCTVDYTAIPDSNFEAALTALGYDDIANDGQVPTILIEAVTSLNVSNNNIDTITGIEDFTVLETFVANDNNLTSLDVSNNPVLSVLEASENNISTLNLGTNTNYENINLNANNLISINVLGFTDLTFLSVNDNPLISADLSSNTALTTYSCNNCNLISLNIKNGNNTNVSTFDVSNNPGLTCVLVDDATYSTNNWTNIDGQTSFSDTFCSPYTAIPDTNFETALDDLGYDDISNDGQVPTASIVSLTSLDVSAKSIADLTGIEHFIALTTLQISDNPITTLDLTNNIQLQTLQAAVCNIAALDISGLTQLTTLNLNSNALTSIDLSAFPDLEVIDLSSNNFTEVDIRNGANTNITSVDFRSNDNLTCVSVDDPVYSNASWTFIDAQTNFTATNYCGYTSIPDSNFEVELNLQGYDDIANDGQVPTDLISGISSLNVNSKNISDLTGIEDFVALTELKADSNNVSAIDLSNNTLIDRLFLKNNNLTSIDLSANTGLLVLTLENNGLTNLDLSTNTAIGRLFLGGNNLTSLDLSNNTALVVVGVNVNNLSSLNIKNGNNTNIDTFVASNNPNLSCIAVDDVDYSTTNWTSIDAQTSFSDYCNYTAIPDSNFETALDDLGYDDISGDGQVPTALIEEVISLSIFSKSIADLTGIEDFTALTILNANDNLLTTIDVSNLTNMEQLLVSTNNLTTIDVSALTNLTRFQGRSNAFTALDFSTNVALNNLNVDDNTALSTLNISQNPLLESIYISNCSISNIDLSNFPNLVYLDVGDNMLPAINFANNPLLEEVYVSNNPIGSIDASGLPLLTYFEAINTNLSYFNFKNGNNDAIMYFSATGNPNLICILVDDASNVPMEIAANVDAQASFNDVDCFSTITCPADITAECSQVISYTIPTVTADGGVADVVPTSIPGFTLFGTSGNSTYFVSDAVDTAANHFAFANANNYNIVTIDSEEENSFIRTEANNQGLGILLIGYNDLSVEGTFEWQSGEPFTYTNWNGVEPNDFGTGEDYVMQLATGRWNDVTEASNSRVLLEFVDYSNGPVLISGLPSGSNFPVGVTANTFMMEDASGNIDTCAFNVTITDTQAPEIICASDITVNNDSGACGAYVVIPQPTVNDLCGSTILIDSGIVPYNFSTGNTLIDTPVTLQGLSNTTLPDIILELTFKGDQDLVTEAFVLNGPDGMEIYTGNGPSGTCLLATDTISIPQTTWNSWITTFGTDLTFTLIANTNVNEGQCEDLAGNYYRIVIPTPGNLMLTNDYTNTPDASGFYPGGTTVVTWTVMDDGGNVTTCIQNIIVNDTVAPVVTCPDEIIVDNDPGVCSAAITVPALQFLDNCPSGSNSIAIAGPTTSFNFNDPDLILLDTPTTLTGVALSFNDVVMDITANGDFGNSTEILRISGPDDTVIFSKANFTVVDCATASDSFTIPFATWNTWVNDYGTDLTFTLLADTAVDIDRAGCVNEFQLTANLFIDTDIVVTNDFNGTADASGTYPLGTTTVTWTATDSAGNSSTCTQDITVNDTNGSCNTISLNLKVFLQGAALNPNMGEETLMRDDLRVEGLIPTTSPYTDNLTCDASVFNATGVDAIVDWVWVELRDVTDNTQVLYSRSALLQRDGDIVDVDGTSSLNFSVISNTYYVAINHRNHLGIMSIGAFTFTAVNNIDFTPSGAVTTFGTNAQTTFGMPTGVAAMWAGDATGDGNLNYLGASSDIPSIRSQVFNDPNNSVFGGPPVGTYQSAGYTTTDVNMNGFTVYSGAATDVLFIRNNIFNNPSNSVFGGPPVGTYIFNEQLP